MRRTFVALLASLTIAGCSVTIADLNSHPTRHYQQTVTLVGVVIRVQSLTSETLLEVADAREKRILVRTSTPVELKPSDWIEVKGLFIPEAKVGGQNVYDVVDAESIEVTKPPMFRDLM